jgi:hypothetical protein
LHATLEAEDGDFRGGDLDLNSDFAEGDPGSQDAGYG